jgi:endogenous inhibitor of DNA gyrase (YacG/DUF329 family)
MSARLYRHPAVESTSSTPTRCPTCRAPVRWKDNPHRPFCSERCRLIDLGNWAAERYRVPSEKVDDDDDNTGGLSQ